jgi:hypothetical protein
MTPTERLKLSQTIEKLSRLTEARGATAAEALLARQKIAVLTARKIAASHGVYVEGWPGQPVCLHEVVYRFGSADICGVCRKQILR